MCIGRKTRPSCSCWKHTRQMSQVCIFTWDNNKSNLKGTSLQLSSRAELGSASLSFLLSFLLCTVCVDRFNAAILSTQVVSETHHKSNYDQPSFLGEMSRIVNLHKKHYNLTVNRSQGRINSSYMLYAERAFLHDRFKQEQWPQWASWHVTGEVLAWRY